MFFMEKELEMNERGVQSQIRKLVLAEEKHGEHHTGIGPVAAEEAPAIRWRFRNERSAIYEVRKRAGGRILLGPLADDASRVCASLVTTSDHSPLLSTSCLLVINGVLRSHRFCA